MSLKNMKKNDLIKEVESLGLKIRELQRLLLENDNVAQKNSLLASIVESSEDAIIGLTIKGAIVSWNKTAEKMFGYTLREVLGYPVSMLASPERYQESLDVRHNALSGQRTSYFQTTRLKKNGSEFPVVINISPIFNSKREIVGMSEIIRDITVQKDMQAALYRNEAKYRSIVENAVEGIFQITKQGRCLNANPAFVRMFGYSSEEELMTEVSDVGKQLYVNPDDRTRFMEAIERDGVVNNLEIEAIRKDGAFFWICANVRAVRDATGGTVFYEGTIEDITKRKQAEMSLILEKTISDSIIESLPAIFYLLDDQIRSVRWNKNLEKALGHSEDEMPRINPLDFFKGKDRETINRAILKCLEKGEVTVEAELFSKGGRKIPYLFTSKRTVLNNKTHLVGVGLDISELKRMEQELRRSEDLLNETQSIAKVGGWGYNVQSKGAVWTNEAYRIMGVSEEFDPNNIAGITQLYDQEDRPAIRRAFRRAIKEGEPYDLELRLASANGARKWVRTIGRPVVENGRTIKVVGYVGDITEKKNTEEKLIVSAEKLRKSLAGTIQVISTMLETRDPYTGGHQGRVSTLASSIAQEMGFPNDTVDIIRMAGTIHDIGKMSVPAEILSRPCRLSDIEMGLLRIHPQTGYDILKAVELPPPIADIVLQHHERLDGSGYPRGLKDGEILLEAQIMSVADVVEAMASHRPYRPALGIDAALEEIEKNKGVLYHPEVVEVCLRLFREKEFKFE